MPKLTPGNSLYIYQLLTRKVGAGRQTLLPRFEEVIVADGFDPTDLGCEDMRELAEHLDFLKVTVFKGGRVYATLVADPELDRMLEKAAAPQQADKNANKPWKRRRGTKAVRPAKPRHAAKPDPEPAPEPEPEPVPEPEVQPVATPEPVTEPATEAAPEPPAEKNGEVVTDAAEPEAEAAAEPAPAAEPGISLTITYDPYADMAADLAQAQTETDSQAQPDSVPGAAAQPVATMPAAAITPGPTPAPEPQPVVAPTPVAIQSDLPQDFSAEVTCRDAELSALYQCLPLDIDPMAVLDEDWRVARATGTFSGTRSNVTFPLRYLRDDEPGQPIQVTLRRAARATAGKYWSLASVECTAAGFEGARRCDDGIWCDLRDPAAPVPDAAASPVHELARTVVIGTWEDLLSELAAKAVPEPWGLGNADDLSVLREYLAMAFHRALAQGLVPEAADGSARGFDTGLLTPTAEPIYCCLAPREGDIPWGFAGFACASDPLGAWLAEALGELPAPATCVACAPAPDVRVEVAPALAARFERDVTPAVTAAMRRASSVSGLAATAIDPAGDVTCLLVPVPAVEPGLCAVALRPNDGDGLVAVSAIPVDRAYALARATSCAVPTWLRPEGGAR